MTTVVPARRPNERGGRTSFPSYLESKLARFGDPWDVVLDPDLTAGEKREVLCDWLSDARAVEDRPELRRSMTGVVASRDELVEGLRLVDSQIAALTPLGGGSPRPSRFRHTMRVRGSRAA